MTALLKVTDLKKAYGAIQAVGGVSFEVQPGEIFGVIGPNGSGKTTLFNSMLGQITPNAGKIELKGEDVTHCGPLELSRRGVGRTFQTLQVFGKMTVRDNLIVAAQEHHGIQPQNRSAAHKPALFRDDREDEIVVRHGAREVPEGVLRAPAPAFPDEPAGADRDERLLNVVRGVPIFLEGALAFRL